MNTTKTEQLKELLVLNDYLKQYLDYDLIFNININTLTFDDSNIIDTIFDMAELHKQYTSLRNISIEAIYGRVIEILYDDDEGEEDGYFTYNIDCDVNANGYDNWLVEEFKEVIPEFAKELRLKTIDKLLC